MAFNADAQNRWRQNFFPVAVRSHLDDGSRWDDYEGSTEGTNSDEVFTSKRIPDYRMENVLLEEVNKIYSLISNQNPQTLQVFDTVSVLAADDRIDLDPPSGRLNSVYREVVKLEDSRVTSGDGVIRYVPPDSVHRVGGTRWTLEGRKLVLRMTGSTNSSVGVAFTLNVHFVPQFVPININSRLPYYALPPEWHPVIARGAALRLMPGDDPDLQKKFAEYRDERDQILTESAGFQSEGGNWMRTDIDFEIAR
jgi:hypothetical protein